MNLPITQEELDQLLIEYNGEIVKKEQYSIIVQIKQTLIKVWLSTGTFINMKTKYRNKGRKALDDYMKYIDNRPENSSNYLKVSELYLSSPSEENLLKLITELSKRVDNLEAEVDNLKATYTPLNAYV